MPAIEYLATVCWPAVRRPVGSNLPVVVVAPDEVAFETVPRWIEHGMSSSIATFQNASSSFESDGAPAGHDDRITPRMPSSLARRISLIAVSTPRFGICARPIRRLESGFMNSFAIQLL